MTDAWPDLDVLIRHIVKTHHHYVRSAVPALTTSLHQLVDHHGHDLPALHGVRQAFAQLGEELLAHMEKEEHILFPYIAELAAAHRGTGPFPPNPFGTVANPVRMMEDDHQEALGLVAGLGALTGNYIPAPDWSPEDRACYAELAHFESDLRVHVDLEDHVLFPRALDLEERLA